MNIKVNGENREIQESTSLQDLFDTLEIKVKIMASAVNMVVIKKNEWNKLFLRENDEVEFLQFVGGG